LDARAITVTVAKTTPIHHEDRLRAPDEPHADDEQAKAMPSGRSAGHVLHSAPGRGSTL
jgi:hypothetical protein